MMDLAALFLAAWFLIFGSIFAGVIWSLSCNDRTFAERTDLLETAFENDWRRYSPMWDSVTYEQHWWTRLTFRDWRKLYPRELIDLYEAAYVDGSATPRFKFPVTLKSRLRPPASWRGRFLP